MGNFSLVAVLTEVVILREVKGLCRLQADAKCRDSSLRSE
jgi:hypothetical protein